MASFVKKKVIGKFKTSGSLYITDPSYNVLEVIKGNKHKNITAILENVKKGLYNVMITYNEIYQRRIESISIIHSLIKMSKIKKHEFYGTIATDTGIIGIFDSEVYPKDIKQGADIFWHQCIDLVREDEFFFQQANIFYASPSLKIGKGTVTPSGWGEGIYNLTCYFDTNDIIIALDIDFQIAEIANDLIALKVMIKDELDFTQIGSSTDSPEDLMCLCLKK